MRKDKAFKMICFILLGIIVFAGIYFYAIFNKKDFSGMQKCSAAYSCTHCNNNVCDCLYCSERAIKTDKCIKEEQIQCEDPRVNNYE